MHCACMVRDEALLPSLHNPPCRRRSAALALWLALTGWDALYTPRTGHKWEFDVQKDPVRCGPIGSSHAGGGATSMQMALSLSNQPALSTAAILGPEGSGVAATGT